MRISLAVFFMLLGLAGAASAQQTAEPRRYDVSSGCQ